MTARAVLDGFAARGGKLTSVIVQFPYLLSMSLPWRVIFNR